MPVDACKLVKPPEGMSLYVCGNPERLCHAKGIYGPFGKSLDVFVFVKVLLFAKDGVLPSSRCGWWVALGVVDC